jgi:enamine deaminase RidA (YjgF/YER057c/UK114 family)
MAVMMCIGGSYMISTQLEILTRRVLCHAWLQVNAIYGKYFTEEPPARATFAVKELPLSARVEIEAIAVL